jgi:hypothetical protein
MIQCPECKTINQPNARFCSGCGVGFTVVPIKTKPNSIKPLFWLLGLLALALFIGGVGSVSNNNGNKAGFTETGETPDTQATSENTPLKLLSMKDINSSDMYFRVIGEVQNTSTEKIDGVFVVVTAYDKSGELVGTEDARIDYSPIMPNQTSPFTVMMRQNPLIDNYQINFRKSFGGTIDYTDARPPKTTAKPKSKK